MDRLREWVSWLVPPHVDASAARSRVERDEQRVELHAQRIEGAADALEDRAARNHISASVEALLRSRRA